MKVQYYIIAALGAAAIGVASAEAIQLPAKNGRCVSTEQLCVFVVAPPGNFVLLAATAQKAKSGLPTREKCVFDVSKKYPIGAFRTNNQREAVIAECMAGRPY